MTGYVMRRGKFAAAGLSLNHVNHSLCIYQSFRNLQSGSNLVAVIDIDEIAIGFARGVPHLFTVNEPHGNDSLVRKPPIGANLPIP